METFNKIEESDWDSMVRKLDCGSMMLQIGWEKLIAKNLPFVVYRHFLYRDTHLVRLVEIAGRYTTTPFVDGSDVLSLSGASLDMKKFVTDLHTQFEGEVRLRINERFTPVLQGDDSLVVAYDYEVSLVDPVLPRVRKTLRHTLSHPIEGKIEQSSETSDIEAAYTLYLRHMRSVKNFALPKSLFISLITNLEGELWTWSLGEHPEAMAIFIPSSTEVLYSLSAASRKAFQAQAPHHLVHTALEHYRSKGIKKASLGATGKDSSLEVFKRGWRGSQYRIYELGSRTDKVGRTSKIRNMVRYVPLALYPLLTKRVGKHLF